MLKALPGLALLLSCAFAASAASVYVPAEISPPALPAREFRGAWVASVANIDWPSKPGLPVKEQKAEMLALLDKAVQMNLNAIVLQVRPACDAIYESKI